MPAEIVPRIPPPSMASATRNPSPRSPGRLPARARSPSTRSTSCTGLTLHDREQFAAHRPANCSRSWSEGVGRGTSGGSGFGEAGEGGGEGGVVDDGEAVGGAGDRDVQVLNAGWWRLPDAGPVRQ